MTLSIKEIKEQLANNNGKIEAVVDYDFYDAINSSFEEIRDCCVLNVLGWEVHSKTSYEKFYYEIYDVDIRGTFSFDIQFVLKDDNNVLSSMED